MGVPGFRDGLQEQLQATAQHAVYKWAEANRVCGMPIIGTGKQRDLVTQIMGALWPEIEQAALGMAEYIGTEQLAAAIARAEKAEAAPARLKARLGDVDAELMRQAEANVWNGPSDAYTYDHGVQRGRRLAFLRAASLVRQAVEEQPNEHPVDDSTGDGSGDAH